jgi:hypothetical protein
LHRRDVKPLPFETQVDGHSSNSDLSPLLNTIRGTRSTDPRITQEWLLQGYGTVREMEHVETNNDVPVVDVIIADCGELEPDALTSTADVSHSLRK